MAWIRTSTSLIAPSCSRGANRFNTREADVARPGVDDMAQSVRKSRRGARGEGPSRRIMQEVGDVSVIGCAGPLIVATRGIEGAGEVLLNVRGSKEAYLAWSSEPLPRGTEVLVIDTRGPRTVLVEAWPGFDS
jgi:hypothetical protein